MSSEQGLQSEQQPAAVVWREPERALTVRFLQQVHVALDPAPEVVGRVHHELCVVGALLQYGPDEAVPDQRGADPVRLHDREQGYALRRPLVPHGPRPLAGFPEPLGGGERADGDLQCHVRGLGDVRRGEQRWRSG
ncbi:hypothetical protein ACFC4G_46780 [Streptomyces sp. NPDC056002]|uniref:hypothetical protein n=1 Tax=Streptomyces sp. NPDC056002 TaxID=3345675 RepID=UPI0035DE0565